jgi:glycerol kinase
MGGKVNYVLEGNINYTGAVITWLKDDLELIGSPAETQQLAEQANPQDTTYLVPAFSGLGAPYWDSDAKAVFCGMTRTTRKAELVKAGLESIAYQITDIIEDMREESGIAIEELRVDGGPTKNGYLMQFQSDMAQIPVQVPSEEELSGIGAAYAAGVAAGIYQLDTVFDGMKRRAFSPDMDADDRNKKYVGWKEAVNKALTTSG